jgi:hypothetical protein
MTRGGRRTRHPARWNLGADVLRTAFLNRCVASPVHPVHGGPMKACRVVGVAFLLVTGVLTLLVAGCRTVPVQYDFVTPMEDALSSVADRPSPEPGSDVETEALARVETLLSDLSTETIRFWTREVYAPDAYLNDTLRTVRGAEAIEQYFLEAAAITAGIQARIVDVTRSRDGLYYFRWTMDVGMERVARGKTVRTLGISLIRLDADGRVLVHQDYWDSTAGLFQHVPGIGRGIRMIKARL